MKLALLLLFAGCCAHAAQIQLSWFQVGNTNPVTIYTSTNVNYTLASLTATTNRMKSQWGSPTATLVLQSWAYYHTSLEEMTLVTTDMIYGWTALATTTNASLDVTVDAAKKRYFTVVDSGSGTISLGWDAANPASNVTGYRLYRGGAAGNYTNITLLGKVTTATVTGLVKGSTNYFVLTATGPSGESKFSTELKVPMARQNYSVFIKRI